MHQPLYAMRRDVCCKEEAKVGCYMQVRISLEVFWKCNRMKTLTRREVPHTTSSMHRPIDVHTEVAEYLTEPVARQITIRV